MRVVLAGCGYFSRFHIEAWQRLPVDIVAVCDSDPDRARAFKEHYAIPAAFSDAGAMLAETCPDIVDIIVPPAGHLPLIRQSVPRARLVICQKPFTRDLAEARTAVQLAKAAGTTLAVHENFRFQPWYRRLRKELDAKRLGTLYQVRFALRPGDGQGPLAYLDRQPYFQSMERFLVRETGIHFIDVFRYLCGEPQAAWADLRRLNPAIAGEDAGLFVLEYGDGLRAVFDGNRLSDHAAEDHRLTLGEMTLEGEHGTLILNGRGELQWRRKGQTESRRLPCEWKAAGPGGDSVFRYQQHVIDHLERGSTLENRADDYLRNLEIEEIIYRSSAAGRRLTC